MKKRIKSDKKRITGTWEQTNDRTLFHVEIWIYFIITIGSSRINFKKTHIFSLWNCTAYNMPDEFSLTLTLREKCPNREFFLARIFLYSDWIQRFTQISVFSPNIGKYGPEKTPYLDTFHLVLFSRIWTEFTILK